jgi:hypothetical protein
MGGNEARPTAAPVAAPKITAAASIAPHSATKAFEGAIELLLRGGPESQRGAATLF